MIQGKKVEVVFQAGRNRVNMMAAKAVVDVEEDVGPASAGKGPGLTMQLCRLHWRLPG